MSWWILWFLGVFRWSLCGARRVGGPGGRAGRGRPGRRGRHCRRGARSLFGESTLSMLAYLDLAWCIEVMVAQAGHWVRRT